MNDKPESREQLSALFDQELEGAACEEAIDRLLSDQEARQRWHHYQRIGQLMRAEADLDRRFSARVSAAIAREPPPTVSARASRPVDWRRITSQPWAGWAAAASLLAVILLMLAHRPGIENGVTRLQIATAPQPVAASGSAAATATLAPAQREALIDHYASYLASHNAYSEQMGGQRIHSAVRLVGLEGEAW